jgi:hypothetical protein
MRKLILSLFLASVYCMATPIAQQQSRPIPPGVREAAKRTNAPLDPPLEPKPKAVDAVKLKQEADELFRLSAAIPGQIEFVAQGKLPKDLREQLRRIEKLAKRLRSEISP